MPLRQPETPFEIAFVKFMQWRGYEAHSPEGILELVDIGAKIALRIHQDFRAGWEAAIAAEIGKDAASRARAFDILIKHVASTIPPTAAIKQLAGTPLVEALTGYVFVPKEEWERLNNERTP